MAGLLEERSDSGQPMSPPGPKEPGPGRGRGKGRRRIEASREVDPQDLRRMLRSLVRESCVHSWRNFGPDGDLEGLRAWENQLRPTEIFFFYLEEGGSRQLIAAGAVASKLARDFPHEGFSVLGRCYILPEFRGRGLYRSLLRYRLEFCRDDGGEELKAIHIGSTDPRIARVLRDHRIPDWPRFVHLGHEALTVAREVRRVEAYLLLLPAYARRLRELLTGDGAPPSVAELRDALGDLERPELRDLGLLADRAVEDGMKQGFFDCRDIGELEQLLCFCRAIPLVGLVPAEVARA